MSELIAKPIVKNKFWVVEDSGNKVATIQATDNGVVFVHDNQREHYPSINILKKKYNIKIGSLKRVKSPTGNTVYGFPVSGRSYNQVWDVQRRLPVYSKTPKSKSLFCAGYYLINLNNTWSEAFCPKNITLSRYPFIGPFKTKEEMKQHAKEIK